ncbi:MAG: ArsR family transcriptional regulator [Candidatus Diapherotrites archaeon]
MTKDWKTISFVIRSRYRKLVLEKLNFPTTPTQLAKDLDINKAHVSRALSELIEKGLVKCLTPEARKGKIFERTTKGIIILKNIQKHRQSP